MKKVVILLLVVILVGSVSAFDYVTWGPFPTETGDCAVYDFPSETLPSKWGTYTDQNFNTTIRRFTDFADETPPTYRPQIQYTTFPPDNADGTIVLFGTQAGEKLFYDTSDGSLLRYRDFGSPDGGDMEFRWSNSNPNVGYFRLGMSFYNYTYSTDTITLIRNFSIDYPSGYAIMNDDKGDFSWDDNDTWWTFRVNSAGSGGGSEECSNVFMYNLVTDTIYDIDMSDVADAQGWDYSSYTDPVVRYVSSTPSGNGAIIYVYDANTGSGARMFIAERSGSDLVFKNDLITTGGAHPAWGYNAEGEEIFTLVNWLGSTGFVQVKIDDGSQTVMFDPDDQAGGGDCSETYPGQIDQGSHISSIKNRNADGWFVYTEWDATHDSNNDFFLQGELFAVYFSDTPNNTKVWRIAHTQNWDDSNYANEARAQVSRDGKYVYFESNFRDNPDADLNDIFRAELPDNWWQDLSNSTYHSADLDRDYVINKTEINTYVTDWKGNPGISLSQLIDAIGKWKAGSYQ